jgi:hypothetical protein
MTGENEQKERHRSKDAGSLQSQVFQVANVENLGS